MIGQAFIIHIKFLSDYLEAAKGTGNSNYSVTLLLSRFKLIVLKHQKRILLNTGLLVAFSVFSGQLSPKLFSKEDHMHYWGRLLLKGICSFHRHYSLKKNKPKQTTTTTTKHSHLYSNNWRSRKPDSDSCLFKWRRMSMELTVRVRTKQNKIKSKFLIKITEFLSWVGT